MKPQTARVLAELRRHPVGSMDFQPPHVCDGGDPITRVAGRIRELRELGYEIRSTRAANGTAVYKLKAEPYTDPHREGNAATTTVEASTQARGSVTPNRNVAVSGTGDERDPASGAEMTGPNGAAGHTRPPEMTGRPRGQCQHDPSCNPANGAQAISRIACADLPAASLFDADQFAAPFAALRKMGWDR